MLCVLCIARRGGKSQGSCNASKLPAVHWLEDKPSESAMVRCVSIASDACDAVRSQVSLPMWANCLSVSIEVNDSDHRPDISLELTTTRASRRATLTQQSPTNSTEPHLNMTRAVHLQLLQSLRALCLAPGWPGSIWKYLEALVRSTGVSGRVACGFLTDIHFPDVSLQPCRIVQRLNSSNHFLIIRNNPTTTILLRARLDIGDNGNNHVIWGSGQDVPKIRIKRIEARQVSELGQSRAFFAIQGNK